MSTQKFYKLNINRENEYGAYFLYKFRVSEFLEIISGEQSENGKIGIAINIRKQQIIDTDRKRRYIK